MRIDGNFNERHLKGKSNLRGGLVLEKKYEKKN
jgi:hypothetical protein